ncbi:hypothetical protein QMK19_22855 [Streptomyces sp. H10-C2]|uniref:hypothetical protein n=1 Tax=unclassified Streptomyces TaxID=2593676 RepID=UPI0024BB8FBE|nr:MULTISPECIES: hypothetical protein [unclassified Streptomyces]MDJ0347021.1 hypothetical protein [Streptomyces sp. PH10-H1]MDJ0372425.1 hypothetical protein [Streptomyces sp. H10-C2]
MLAALLGWSLLEAGETFLTGFALARALDDGFLAGHSAVGLGWLGAAALAVAAGAYGTGRDGCSVRWRPWWNPSAAA